MASRTSMACRALARVTCALLVHTKGLGCHCGAQDRCEIDCLSSPTFANVPRRMRFYVIGRPHLVAQQPFNALSMQALLLPPCARFRRACRRIIALVSCPSARRTPPDADRAVAVRSSSSLRQFDGFLGAPV